MAATAAGLVVMVMLAMMDLELGMLWHVAVVLGGEQHPAAMFKQGKEKKKTGEVGKGASRVDSRGRKCEARKQGRGQRNPEKPSQLSLRTDTARPTVDATMCYSAPNPH